MFAEGVKDGGERQLATMSGAKSPANNLPSLEVEHDRDVVLLTLEAEVGEILHPSTGT